MNNLEILNEYKNILIEEIKKAIDEINYRSSL